MPGQSRKYDSVAKIVNNDARQMSLNQDKFATVPLQFDDEGRPLTDKTFNPAKHLKRLSLKDLQFLHAWRESGWDVEKACRQCNLNFEIAQRLVKKMQVFKNEDDRIKALADIPSPAFITAKHTENVFEGKLDDSQRDSLKELAKITGAYKPTQSVNVQVTLVKPAWTPEQEAKVRDAFDTIAEPNHAA